MNCAPATARHHYKSRHNYTTTMPGCKWYLFSLSLSPPLSLSLSLSLLLLPLLTPTLSRSHSLGTLAYTRAGVREPLPPPVYKCLRHVAFNVSNLSRSEFCGAALASTSQPCVPFSPFVAVINIWWYVVVFRTRPRTSTFLSRTQDTRGFPQSS